MTLTALYPDPFADDVGACSLTCDLTVGPCFAQSPRRSDISEGSPGVPLRLALRVVESDGCTPIAGADVDVWHCGPDGLYTGDDALTACTRGDEGAAGRRTFRGTLTTDENGRVAFDSCFPGWYPGRAVHIHLRVQSARGTVASQLFFPEGITADITRTVRGYLERGLPDTAHDDDLLAAEDDPARFVLAAAQMPDGALLAWKTIVLLTPGAAPDAACG